MRHHSCLTSSKIFTRRSRLGVTGATTAILALLVGAAGCSAQTDAAATASADEGRVATAQQAIDQGPSTLPLTIYSGGEWTTMQYYHWYNSGDDSDGWLWNQDSASWGGPYRGATGDADVIPLRVRQNLNGAQEDVFALFKNGTWRVDTNNDRMSEADEQTYNFGQKGDYPVSGNWSSTGIGIFRGGLWILDTNANGYIDGADRQVRFGSPGDIPVVGDWNGDGHSKLGVFNPYGAFYLDMNGNNAWDGADRAFGFGQLGDKPFVGAFTGGAVEQVGVMRPESSQRSSFWLDTNGVPGWNAGDIGMMTDQGHTGTPLFGSWSARTVLPMPPLYAGIDVRTMLLQPLEGKFRNSASDPSSIDDLVFETEYLATVEYSCDRVCPTTLGIAAGAHTYPITPVGTALPGARAMSVVGFGPLHFTDSDPSTTRANGFSATSHVYAEGWYAAPSDATLHEWSLTASYQADTLTRAKSSYVLTKSYADLAAFNRDQIGVLIDTTQKWADAAKTPIEKRKWQAMHDSLVATRDATPGPVPAAQMQQYLTELVSNARADMLLQADRAQTWIALFERAEAGLKAAGVMGAQEIERLRSDRAGKLTATKTDVTKKLKDALSLVPDFL